MSAQKGRKIETARAPSKSADCFTPDRFPYLKSIINQIETSVKRKEFIMELSNDTVLSHNLIAEIAAQHKHDISCHLSRVLYAATEWGVDEGYTISDCRTFMIWVAYVVGRLESNKPMEMRKAQKEDCNMNGLQIFEKNGTLWTDSRDVAAMVDKQHKNLMADIRGYVLAMQNSTKLKIQPSDFFSESTYVDSTGRTLPCYLISKKGCEFIANKLTGTKGTQFTALYVSKFNDMERHEQKKVFIPDPNRQTLAEAKLNNSRARVSSQWLKLAEKVNIPEYRQICTSYASQVLAGREVIPLPASAERYYTATEVGSMLGVTSQRIGIVANRNNIKTPENGKLFFDKSPHSNKEVQTFKYNDRGVKQLSELLGQKTA